MDANNLKLTILFATWALVSSYHESKAEASLESDGRELEASPVMGLHEEARDHGQLIITNPHTSRRNITCNRSYCGVATNHEHATCRYSVANEYGVALHEQGCCTEPCASYSRTRGYYWCWVEDTDSWAKWDRCEVGVPYYKAGSDPNRFIEYKPLPKWNIPRDLPHDLSKNLIPCKENSPCIYQPQEDRLSCETTDGEFRECCSDRCVQENGYWWCRISDLPEYGYLWDYCTEGAPFYNYHENAAGRKVYTQMWP